LGDAFPTLFPITFTPGNLPTITSTRVSAAGEILEYDDDIVPLVDEQLIKINTINTEKILFILKKIIDL
jgi:hypothetical protein